MDLRRHTLDDLLAMRRQVDDELERRHRERPRETENELSGSARKWGYALAEVLTGVTSKAEREASHPRYQHPYDPHLTWSGAGSKPHWVREWEATGHALEELRIRH